MTGPLALLVALTSCAGLCAPYVAYVGNVPVHSASPEAKVIVVDLATGTARNVSQGLHSARCPSWSPDGSRLAFEAVAEGLCDVFVCAPDGSGRVNVTDTPDAWEAAPCFVDAHRVAYLSGPDRAEVWLADLQTTQRRCLSPTPRFCTQPTSSRDGKLLAVAASEKLVGPGHIILVATDGSEEHVLTPAAAMYSRPCFSGDGKSILFAFDGCQIEGALRGLASVPLSGSEPKLLARDAYPLSPLSTAPDGTVAFTWSAAYHSTWVHLLKPGATGSEALAVQPYHITGWPSFSANGKLVAFQGVYAAICTVQVLDLATGELRRLTPPGETGVNPVFSP